MSHYKLPVIEIIKNSLTTPIKNLKSFLFAVLPSYSVILLLNVVSTMLQMESNLIFTLLTAITSVFFAISCHRHILLGPDPTSKFGVFEWGQREWSFIIWGVVVYFFYIAITLMSAAAASLLSPLFDDTSVSITGIIVISVICLAPGVYVFSRLSLFFPAIAIDKDINWDLMWNLSKGNGWRLFCTISFTPILITIPFVVLNNLYPIMTIFTLPFILVIPILTIVLLSLSYQGLEENQTNEIVNNG